MLETLKVLSLIATPAIAIIVAVIAWRQWETARQKLMLDLFGERLKVYKKVTRALRLIPADPQQNITEAISLLFDAKDASQFLYGQEVTGYIRQLIEVAADLRQALNEYNSENPSDRDLAQEMLAANTFLDRAHEELPVLLKPYLRMDQRLPFTKPATAPSFR